MHIEESILVATTTGKGLAAGCTLLAAAGTAMGLRRLDYERMPQVAMLSAAFFVASLIHVPLGFTSVHLVLNGLAGLVLGWAVFPALLIAMLLQAVLFGFGGLTTLGANTVVMALPGVAVHYLFRNAVQSRAQALAASAGFAAGGIAILLSAAAVAGMMVAVGESFHRVAQVVLLAHVPVALVEGLVTSGAVAFLRKVRPELLQAPLLSSLEVGDA